MSTMNMPGFIAEMSFYEASKQYQMARVSRASRSEGAIVPQQQMEVGQGLAPARWCLCPCCICRVGWGIIICYCC